MTISVLDSTLRDGAQGERISYSVQDKLHLVETLDELGVTFIEAGNPGSNPKDMEFFKRLKKLRLKHAEVAAFGATRRKDTRPAEDTNLQQLLGACTATVVVFGKASPFQVKEILKADMTENLDMIAETVEFLKANDRDVIFDAEHFFDALREDRDYALKTLEAAASAGASCVALCDTRGGALPSDIKEAVEAARKALPENVALGIHAHDDLGLGIANTLAAVEAGARHVQGTFLGFGERTGNANLSAVIATLELKMGCKVLPEGMLSQLTPTAKRVAEITNITLNPALPYVGQNAFAHKAGMHIDAVIKNPSAYEHIQPETVGNVRVFLMSEVAGRSTIIEKLKKFDPGIEKNSETVALITKKVKEMEHWGYQFEGADGSFELLLRKTIGKYRPFFKLHYYKILGEKPRPDNSQCSFAQIKIEVDDKIEVTAGEGDGPVHALDIALRKALERFYPAVSAVRLIDYKVRVLDASTAARVRVLIESTDGSDTWTTVGVSADIVEASWIAIVDSFEYKFIKDVEKKFRLLL
ncbi:MAG: citramalate synthase [Spirochaetaceae bacterium]|jgi:2-isopropylmalate synthase|nr:citramalate synthase [Spirochaetaceae bacterium]